MYIILAGVRVTHHVVYVCVWQIHIDRHIITITIIQCVHTHTPVHSVQLVWAACNILYSFSILCHKLQIERGNTFKNPMHWKTDESDESPSKTTTTKEEKGTLERSQKEYEYEEITYRYMKYNEQNHNKICSWKKPKRLSSMYIRNTFILTYTFTG